MAQIDILRAKIPEITDTSKDALLYALLDDAQTAILSKRYPFSEFPDEFPEKYNNLQVRLALVYYNKIGVEGQSGHSENGINRSYESDDTLLKDVVPYVGLPATEV
jgi:hypothetical protein